MTSPTTGYWYARALKAEEEATRLRGAIGAAERAILGAGTNEADLRLHEMLSPLWRAADDEGER